MDKDDWLAERFEKKRAYLRAVAYRMLGSVSEADDAVQETWLRLNRSDSDGIENLDGWLTTVIGRVCLDMLRSRKLRGEIPLGSHLPDPIVSLHDRIDPEQQALLADAVGLALFAVLETLTPAERLAFVLHDVFGVSFDEIASIVGRSTAAARQLASRARKRIREAPAKGPDTDLARQREVVNAFITAEREGDFNALLAVFAPDVLLRADRGVEPPGASIVIRGARIVVERAMMFSNFASSAREVVVNGAAGIIGMEHMVGLLRSWALQS